MQVRIQLGEGSAVEVTKKIIRNEGIGGFYKVLLLLSDSYDQMFICWMRI